MSPRVQSSRAEAASSPASPGLLLRKCATCGGSAGPLGECEECKKKRLDFKLRPGAGPMTGEGDEGAPAPAPEPEPVAAEPEPGPEAESETPEESTGTVLLVEDDAEELAPGQMRKSDFLAELRPAVCAAAEEALAPTGRTSKDCPYIEYWLDFFGNRSSQYLERCIHRYVRETTGAADARDYIGAVASRLRGGVEAWARTGELSEVPEGVPTALPGEGGGSGSTGEIAFKGRQEGARKPGDLREVQAELGEGRRLESGVESKMSAAFGTDFSRVRVHTDATAQNLSNRYNARAFTLGEHVAFASGEYRPGTLVGDALLAHELAHVVQQSGAGAPAPQTKSEGVVNALENDADQAAVGAVVSIWSRGKAALKDIAANALPSLKTGLQLQRCPCEPTTPAPKLTKVQHPLLTPETLDCGGLNWGITWELQGAKPHTDGWIIQDVEQTFDVKDCDGNPIDVLARTKELVKRKFKPSKTGGPITSPTDPKDWPFSEAWRVKEGTVRLGNTSQPHQADVYSVVSMGSFPDLPETKGTVEIKGTADYFDCLDLPSSFKTGRSPAPTLPIARPPAMPSGGTGSIPHNIKIEWNCCKEDKKTKIVSKS